MAQALTVESITTIFLTGFIPPLLWLWFWLREAPHHESRKSLFTSFILGIAVVPFVLLAEYLWFRAVEFSGLPIPKNFNSLWLIIPWAFAEEAAKFAVAWWADLRRSIYYDEPVDAIIYLITVALGFAAMENVLFLNKVTTGGAGIFALIQTADLRFIGATILHTVSSGIIGVSIAFTFFHREHHIRNIWGGIILATVLHTAFNKFIIGAGGSEAVFKTFFGLWTLALILIFFFEKVKRIKN